MIMYLTVLSFVRIQPWIQYVHTLWGKYSFTTRKASVHILASWSQTNDKDYEAKYVFVH